MIVAADGEEKADEHGNKDDGDPRAFGELCEQDDNYSDAGD